MAKRAERSQTGEAAGHVAESGRSMGGERQVRTRPTALRVRGTSWGGENAADLSKLGHCGAARVTSGCTLTQ